MDQNEGMRVEQRDEGRVIETYTELYNGSCHIGLDGCRYDTSIVMTLVTAQICPRPSSSGKSRHTGQVTRNLNFFLLIKDDPLSISALT